MLNLDSEDPSSWFHLITGCWLFCFCKKMFSFAKSDFRWINEYIEVSSMLSTQLHNRRRKFVCEHVRYNARKCLSNVRWSSSTFAGGKSFFAGNDVSFKIEKWYTFNRFFSVTKELFVCVFHIDLYIYFRKYEKETAQP